MASVFSSMEIEGAVGNGGDQRGHNGLARPVALHAHDTPRTMRGLAGQAQLSLDIAVEGHTIPQKVLDARSGLEARSCATAGSVRPAPAAIVSFA